MGDFRQSPTQQAPGQQFPVQDTSSQYASIRLALEHMNKHLFDGILPPCVITIQRRKGAGGYFIHQNFITTGGSNALMDEIALNPEYLCTTSLMDTLSTLAHEQCHQWQFHYGTPSIRTYHNREWANKMKEIGLHPSHTGEIGGRETGQRIGHYIIAGGPFERQAKTLIARKFRIDWGDRFIPMGRIDTVSIRNDDTGHMDTKITYREQDPAVQKMAVTKEKKQKVKYTHRCDKASEQSETFNVWGKPDLRLHCGYCNGIFQV